MIMLHSVCLVGVWIQLKLTIHVLTAWQSLDLLKVPYFVYVVCGEGETITVCSALLLSTYVIMSSHLLMEIEEKIQRGK